MTIPATMRAAVIHRFGGADELVLEDVPTPQPGPGEMLVKVAYAGVNPADWKDREGHTAAFFDIAFPHIIGFDAAGTVAALGEGVTDFEPGERVFTTSDHGEGVPGSYAEYMRVSALRLARIPDGLAMREAAAVPVAAMTAWQALFAPDRGNGVAGQRVLVHGASGGVGSFAVQFAAHAGLAVAGTCSARNLDYVGGLGADLVLDYGADIAAPLADWAPDGVDLIIDAAGADRFDGALDLLAPCGRLVSIATLVADGNIAGLAEAAAARGFSRIYAVMDNSNMRAELSHIGALIAVGEIRLPPIEEFALDDVRSAHEQVQSGHTRGKLVLRVGGEAV